MIEESNRKHDNPPRGVDRAHVRHRLHPAPHQALADRLERGAPQHRPGRPARLLRDPLPAGEHDRAMAGDVGHGRGLAALVGRTFGAAAPRDARQAARPAGAAAGGLPLRPARPADIQQGYSVLGWHTPGVGARRRAGARRRWRTSSATGRASRLYRAVVAPDGAATVAAVALAVRRHRRASSSRRRSTRSTGPRSTAALLAEVERMRGPRPDRLRAAAREEPRRVAARPRARERRSARPRRSPTPRPSDGYRALGAAARRACEASDRRRGARRRAHAT